MQALTNAIAALVALEARAVDLVAPAEAIFDAVKGVVKEAVIVVGTQHAKIAELEAHVAEITTRLEALEAHMAALTEAPAIASDVKPFPQLAAAPVIPEPLPIKITPPSAMEQVVALGDPVGLIDPAKVHADLAHLEGADVKVVEDGTGAAAPAADSAA